AMPFADAYLRISFVGIPFPFLYPFVMLVRRGAGPSKPPFWFLLFSVALDIVLNPLLIFGVGPFPRMDIAGSATATLIAQVASLVALIGYLHHRRHPLFLHADERRFLRPDRAILTALVK